MPLRIGKTTTNEESSNEKPSRNRFVLPVFLVILLAIFIIGSEQTGLSECIVASLYCILYILTVSDHFVLFRRIQGFGAVSNIQLGNIVQNILQRTIKLG